MIDRLPLFAAAGFWLRDVSFVGRAWAVRLRAGLGLVAGAGQVPTGLSAAAIDADAGYAVGVALAYAQKLESLLGGVAGRAILELGPGRNLGAALGLLALGASRVAVADRFPVRWRSDYHPAFYQCLAARMADAAPGCRVDLLRRVAGEGVGAAIETFAVGAEFIPAADGAFDAVVSQAVLEHLAAPEQAFANLYRITAPGGVGVHQVDFRDHRDFSRPLDLALSGPRRFAWLFKASNGECGCRLRAPEMAALMERAGFRVEGLVNIARVEDSILAAALTRLPAARGLGPEDLAVGSAQFLLRREG